MSRQGPIGTMKSVLISGEGEVVVPLKCFFSFFYTYFSFFLLIPKFLKKEEEEEEEEGKRSRFSEINGSP